MNSYVCQTCKICGKSILVTDDAVTCGNCKELYHKHCWEQAETCKTCAASTADTISIPVSMQDLVAIAVKNETAAKQTEMAPEQKAASPASATKRTQVYRPSETSPIFSYIGEKIRNLAVIVTGIEIAIGIIAFLVLAFADAVLWGLLALGIIALLAWVSSFTLYGFGTLIVQSKTQADCLYEILQRLDEKEE